jgi:hypothetical protein
MANSLDPENWSKGMTIRMSHGGAALPDHMKNLYVYSASKGRSVERADSDLRENISSRRWLKWNKPHYQKGGTLSCIESTPPMGATPKWNSPLLTKGLEQEHRLAERRAARERARLESLINWRAPAGK